MKSVGLRPENPEKHTIHGAIVGGAPPNQPNKTYNPWNYRPFFFFLYERDASSGQKREKRRKTLLKKK